MLVSSSVLGGHPIRSFAAGFVLCGVGLCPTAKALERVNLTTGFSYDCTRQEQADAEHIRLYLYSASNPAESSNYIVVSRQQIASVENLPDPPFMAAKPPTVAETAVSPTVNIPQLLAKAGAQHNIDVELLASVVKAESGGRSNAVSRAGARGLMQLMPDTARDLGVQDAFRPDQNIAGGASYLDSLLTRYKNDLSLALAAYNAGPAAVDKYHGIPPYRETRSYVVRVEKEFIRRKKAVTPNASAALAAVVSH